MSRRRFVEILGRKPYTTFKEFKAELVTRKNGMNLATLYRIVESFKTSGLIHEVDIGKDRAIFPCQCPEAEKEKGLIITVCNNCHSIADTHFPLESGVADSRTVQYTKSCGKCTGK